MFDDEDIEGKIEELRARKQKVASVFLVSTLLALRWLVRDWKGNLLFVAGAGVLTYFEVPQLALQLFLVAFFLLRGKQIYSNYFSGIRFTFKTILFVTLFEIGSWAFIANISSLYTNMPGGGIPNPTLSLVVSLLMLQVVYLLMKYFFYYVPLFFNFTSLQRVRAFCETLARHDPLLPWKVLFVSLTLSFVLIQIILIPNPFGILPGQKILLSLASTLFPLFSTYLSLSAGIVYLSNFPQPITVATQPHILKLEAHQAPQWMKNIAPLRKIFHILLITLVVWGTNEYRKAVAPPPFATEIQTVSQSGTHAVTIRITVTDPEFNLETFNSGFFFLGGEDGFVVSEGLPEEVSPPSLKQSEEAKPQRTIDLKFTLSDTYQDVRNLKDLYLWYFRTRLSLISPLLPEADPQKFPAIEEVLPDAVPVEKIEPAPTTKPAEGVLKFEPGQGMA